MKVRHLDAELIGVRTRANIGEAGGEPVARHHAGDRRAIAGGHGTLEQSRRLGAIADHGPDLAFAQRHHEVRHRRVRREIDQINARRCALARRLERLAVRHLRDVPIHPCVDIDRCRRQHARARRSDADLTGAKLIRKCVTHRGRIRLARPLDNPDLLAGTGQHPRQSRQRHRCRRHRPASLRHRPLAELFAHRVAIRARRGRARAPGTGSALIDLVATVALGITTSSGPKLRLKIREVHPHRPVVRSAGRKAKHVHRQRVGAGWVLCCL